ncbi:MAG TPA: ABC transporter permease [Candidatus Saccharimonadales bacterium]|nr:ABC transporter permease [Candidatus Saccharimonadales bacterium]
MRTADYLRIAGRDIRRQPVRSLLTVSALVISTAILVTLGSLSLGAREAIVTALSPDNSLTTIMVTSNKAGSSGLFGNVQVAGPQNAKLDDTSVQHLAAIPGVEFASPRAHVWEFNTFTVAGHDKPFVAQTEAVGVENDRTMPLAAGRGFTAASTAHEVILGAAYAHELGYEARAAELVGKTITITTQKGYRGEGAAIPGPLATAAANDAFAEQTTSIQATVVGITQPGSNQGNLFIPLEWGRQVRTSQWWEGPNRLKKTDQFAETGYTSVIVRAASTEAVAGVTAAIDGLGFGQVSTLAVVQKLMTFSTIMWVILGSVALVALLAASLGIVNTMLMMVSEQRYVIGVWRAVGARKSQIAMQFLLQAILLGLFGGVIGAAAGYGISTLVNQQIVGLLQSQNLAVINIPAAPLWLLAGSVALTVFFAVLAGLYPAGAAARQDPSKSLSAV